MIITLLTFFDVISLEVTHGDSWVVLDPICSLSKNFIFQLYLAQIVCSLHYTWYRGKAVNCLFNSKIFSLSQLMEGPIAKCLCLVWRHTHVYCICISKIKKTLSCFVEICQAIETTDNDLLRKEGAKHFKLVHTNETYAGILYHVQCTCIMPTHVQVLSWHDLWVSFGLLTSGLYCTCRS